MKILALAIALAACAAEPTEHRAADALDAEHPAVLRYSYLADSGWVVVIDVLDVAFSEQVTVHEQDADVAAQPIAALGDGHEIWAATHLPALEPLVFSIHDRLVYSGGTGAERDDATYRAADGRAAMGSGVDLAVAALAVTGSALSAELVVRNLAYAKDVRAVYSTDAWQTVQVAPAHYDHGGGDGAGLGEIWTLEAAIDPSATSLALAAVVDEGGVEAWDNNDGANYACTKAASWTCRGDALVTP
jgi:hypothetical protein